MKYKVKQTSFLNWSWQRASARIILLTTQNKRGTLRNLIYPAIKWLLSHLHELFFSEIYYFTFHDMVHHSTLWGNIRTVKYNVLFLATSWDLKHWGNKDFKSLATVCRGKQWFIHIDDILLFKNDAIEFEKEKPNKIKIHTLNWNNLNYFSTESDEVRLGYYLYNRLHDIQEWKQLDYKVTID